MNWKNTKELLEEWIEQIGTQRCRHNPSTLQAYQEAINLMSIGDFEALLHNRIETLLHHEATNQKLIPKPLKD